MRHHKKKSLDGEALSFFVPFFFFFQMGRLFLETLSDSSDAGGAIYACVGCGAELASSSALVWEVRGN